MKKIARKNLRFEGMHCRSCQNAIEGTVSGISGVRKIHADYATQKGYVEYDENKVAISAIFEAIEGKGYAVIVDDHREADGGKSQQESASKKILRLSAITLGVLVVFIIIGKIYGAFGTYDLSSNMSYGLIFVTGLITGFHCIAMCGGFVVSYVAKNTAEGVSGHSFHIAYGSGKLISYTVIGALFGLLGSVIAFTPQIRATIGLVAGLFLILFGLNLLDVSPFLRRFQLRMPSFISARVNSEQSKHTSPFVVGLLNGLMIACGPLQAMYVLAAGIGNIIEGAKIMFIFGVGTLPMLLGFGVVAGRISKSTTRSILKYSGVIVVLLGLIMLNRALIIYGSGYDLESIAAKTGILTVGEKISGVINADKQQVVRMNVLRGGYEPSSISIKRGVPVKWIITVEELTGCNKEILVPMYDLDIRLIRGEQTVEFTPDKNGVVTFTCGMGMLRGSFIVSE